MFMKITTADVTRTIVGRSRYLQAKEAALCPCTVPLVSLSIITVLLSVSSSSLLSSSFLLLLYFFFLLRLFFSLVFIFLFPVICSLFIFPSLVYFTRFVFLN